MTEELLPALIHLTAPRRGTVHPLSGGPLVIGSGATADVHVPADPGSPVDAHHATLERREEGWWVQAQSGSGVFLNGDRVMSGRLLPGDVLQLGTVGPLLRYRLEPSESGYKSLRDALADCVACAQYGADALPAQLAIALRAMPQELLSETSPWTRAAVASVLVAVLGGTAYQVVQGRALDDRLAQTRSRLESVAESLRVEREERVLTAESLDSLRRADARPRRPDTNVPAILSDATGSVMFVLGSYGFEDPESDRVVHVRGERPASTTGTLRAVPPGAGTRPLRRRYTGTAFAVTDRGHFITNRHLVRPWRHDAVAKQLIDAGFRPRLEELRGYLPGRKEPIDLRLAAESDSADLALFEASGLEMPPEALPLGPGDTSVGEDVYLIGYPTGVRALLARSDPAFVAQLRGDSTMRDSWRITQRLADAGAISPLTTRGIVGQVSPSAVVYDAETSQGGSGGPLLDDEGRVVAVNMGLMQEFGGSNLGVPVRHVRRLLEETGVTH